ncbi:unnamed protein product [Nippostrongylus brasiliensis]|uniref:ShKT domain-containing protein n=1 Tax=Nippostrongylus brasiliensis TaxID=27835 RepID=A0A0N4XCJ5_NIPBR|nr:unnamed protein product [Nippostrongylus brasiliensis]
MAIVWLVLAIGIATSSADEVDSHRFCEAYAECLAVATLEERSCLGSSKWRPFWFPVRRDEHDCHHKLRNDYIILDRMEEELLNLFLSCLKQNTRPFSESEVQFPHDVVPEQLKSERIIQKASCDSRALKSTSGFTYGRCLHGLASDCFAGTLNRINRECAPAKRCCAAVPECWWMLKESPMAAHLREMREKTIQRGKDCKAKTIELLQDGLPVEQLPLPSCYNFPVVTESSGMEDTSSGFGGPSEGAAEEVPGGSGEEPVEVY